MRPAEALLRELYAAGISVKTRGDDLVVFPVERLTEKQADQLAALKQSVIAVILQQHARSGVDVSMHVINRLRKGLFFKRDSKGYVE